MTELVKTRPPYAAPYWDERAWMPDGRDEWALDALRDGFTDALEVWVKMEERDPDQARPATRTARFRSNRVPIDADIVDSIWAMKLSDIAELIKVRQTLAREAAQAGTEYELYQITEDQQETSVGGMR